jgi:hypothetical protein
MTSAELKPYIEAAGDKTAFAAVIVITYILLYIFNVG